MKLKLALLTPLLFSFNASAFDFEEKSTQFCSKIKVCVLKDMAESGEFTPEMEAMMKPMIDGMCDQIKQSTVPKSADMPKELEPELAACLDSMLALNCEALMGGESETTACKALEKKAEKYQ